MIQYLKLLHDIYKDRKDDSEKKVLLRAIIKSEAMLNNDLASVIVRGKPMEVAKNTPLLFQQFETSSFELLATLGLSAHEVFDDKRDPTEKEIESLDSGSKSLNYFESRPQSELYEFYVRKTRLLNSLSRANAISTTNIGLARRIKNIEYATRFLSKKMK